MSATDTVSQGNGPQAEGQVAVLHRDGAAAVLSVALELAGRTTVPESAVAELADAALAADPAFPAGVVRQAQARLLTALARNPFFDAEGVRASRLLFAASDALEASAATAAALATAA